jgi:hypothetical protein
MKLVKTLFATAALVASSFAAQATPITVGGVTWDPDYVDASDNDFIGEFKFTQWFATTTSTLGSLNNYSSAVGINQVVSSLNGSGTNSGYFLQGIGEFDRINGLTGGFCNNCELLYAFGGIELKNDLSFDITNAWARVWTNNLFPDYTSPASNQAEVNDALVGFNMPWLDLAIVGLDFQPGSLVSDGKVSAIFKATGGKAFNNFDQGLTNGLISYTANANFSTSVTVNNPNGAKFSSGGNGSVLSDTIPEPSSLAILGLGLLGLASAARRKQVK